MKLYKWKKVLILSLIILFVIIFLVAPMAITIIAYETNFNLHVKTSDLPSSLTFEDFPLLARESISFSSDNKQILRGYVYRLKDSTQTPKGLIVFSHGYLGTHTDYLNQIDYFVQNGYLVLGYDNTGCGLSDGSSMIGLAQSPIDLDYALKFVESTNSLKQYPILLYGHSWGGYAVSAVLNYNHNIAGVVSRSGFSNSRDMLVEYGSRLYGDFLSALSPYVYVYEKCKFGNSIDLNGVKGINQSTCPILLLHSMDDKVISLKNSLLIHKDEYTNPERIQTILYEDKTHDVVTSYDTLTYEDALDEMYAQLKKQYSNDIPKEALLEYQNSIDKKLSHKLDEEVMKDILDFYDTCTKKGNEF